MMIMHVVTFRWKDGVTDEMTAAGSDALTALVPSIPEVVGYWHGKNLGLRPGTADYAVVAVIKTAEDLPKYLDHPEHLRIVSELLAPLTAERMATQIDVGDSPLSGGVASR
jgi:hypothetical protein